MNALYRGLIVAGRSSRRSAFYFITDWMMGDVAAADPGAHDDAPVRRRARRPRADGG